MTASPGDPGGRPPRPRSPLALAGILLLAACLAATFVGLGVWQLQRRVWKLALIEAVNARVHAPPVAAPGPAAWSSITAARDAYRHVQATGVFLNDRETRVQAVAVLGAGYWVITPLKTDQGFTLLVNRGFVPPERRDPSTRPAGQIEGPTQVGGLLRMSEPGGGFLRRNDPGGDRWYSRDVAAIAAARGLTGAAPYFIDAEGGVPGGPVGGLTVVTFPNSHLVYALTWFTLAAMVACGAGVVVLEHHRSSRRGATP